MANIYSGNSLPLKGLVSAITRLATDKPTSTHLLKLDRKEIASFFLEKKEKKKKEKRKQENKKKQFKRKKGNAEDIYKDLMLGG